MSPQTQKTVRTHLTGMVKCCLLFSMLFQSTALYAAWDKLSIQEMVADEAGRQNFSIPLALAVAETESDFNPYARSHVDARGVMQILPKTAEEDLGVRATSLYNPRVNIRAGVRFLMHLVSVYDGRVDIALSHYNGGSRVRQKDGSLKVIPATQAYVEKVLTKAEQYRSHPLVNARKTPKQFASDKPQRHINIATLASREALDDFEHGDPLLRHRSAYHRSTYQGGKANQALSEIKAAHTDAKAEVINKLKNLVIYNQNRAISGGANEQGSNKLRTNLHRDSKNDLVSEW